MRAAGVRFEIAPYVRFKGEVGEQATMFFRDPSGNAIEIKAFADLAEGARLLSADYSQVELRVLAHVADEQVLKENSHHGLG